MGVLVLAGTKKGLFLLRSDDGRRDWELEGPLLDGWEVMHATVDPTDANRVYIAISAAGTFRTDDGGETWQPFNKNVAADFHPEKYPEYGQCVHKLHLHPARPERLWQQNHCGVYRSDDRAESWERLDGNGLPSDFGFPIILHPRDPDVAYVIPEVSGEKHHTVDGRLGVYKTTDAGESWELA